MPVLIVGADTPTGGAIVEALLAREGETRVFVTDPNTAERFKALGVKVAIGDVSDASHVGGAGLNTFSMVFVEEAAEDDRERAFAATPPDVIAAWVEAGHDAGTSRVIWVGAHPPPDLTTAAPEVATVDPTGRTPAQIGKEVARLDDLAAL